MKRHLFLTGPIGCGKSTAITVALGKNITRCGGFLTRRHREPYLHFTLESPDGNTQETFLDFTSGKPAVDLTVFSERYLQGRPIVLDEIGGIELLNSDFTDALKAVLSSDTPIIGVIKGEGPAGALIDKLGLTEEYQSAAGKLRQQLRNDPNTLVYECSQYDENALLLARQWVEETFHGQLL
jgi:nucleoside-triphosphatase THEP1